MNELIDFYTQNFESYGNYLVHELGNPSWHNYFYALIVISLFVWVLEIIFPWRKEQSVFRKDFFLDLFYMFFNFFIFNLIAFVTLSNGFENLLKKGLSLIDFNIESLQLININEYPLFLRLILFFLITDFIQWNVHRLLHYNKWLWNFHKVHHSVKQMGFAAHLRYHWMEIVVYRSFLYLPLAIIGGFEVDDVIIVHLFALTIGHLNHANFRLKLGPLKYILNNAEMHIWHHAKALPKAHRYGANFGITLSLWDYLFKTNYIPKNGRDIELGFKNDELFPKDFLKQEIYPIDKKD